jgi:hypothetical protein
MRSNVKQKTFENKIGKKLKNIFLSRPLEQKNSYPKSAPKTTPFS